MFFTNQGPFVKSASVSLRNIAQANQEIRVLCKAQTNQMDSGARPRVKAIFSYKWHGYEAPSCTRLSFLPIQEQRAKIL